MSVLAPARDVSSAPLAPEALGVIAARTARRIARRATRTAARPGGRWYVRLRADEHYDVWLISWGAGSSVDAHDHGGSSGAFAVVRGALVEHTIDSDRHERHRVVTAGGVRAFDAAHRHRVANDDTRVALSVHVYSPPLASMTFFDGRGDVDRVDPIEHTTLVVE